MANVGYDAGAASSGFGEFDSGFDFREHGARFKIAVFYKV